MLRINLLPPYIYEGAKRRNVYVLWVLLLLAAVGGLIAWKIKLGNEADRIAADTEPLKKVQADAKNTQSKADALVASNAALKQKADFVRSAKKYNSDTYPPLLGNVGNYTITRVLYSSMVPAGNQVSLAAYAPSLSDVGHYIMAMEKNPNVVNVSIAMNSIPDFPNNVQPTQAQQIGFQFPGMGQGAGAAPMGAAPMVGGMGPGGGGPGMSGGGGTMAMMMGGPRGQRGRGGAAAGGGFGGSQQTGPADRPAGGHDFTVTLTLDQKVAIPAPPNYGGGGGGAPAAGGAPMMGGGGGTSSGMSAAMGSPGGGTGGKGAGGGAKAGLE